MTHRADPPAPDQAHTTDTSMADFRAATAAQWRTAFLVGDVSAVELTATALTAAAAGTSLGAFIHVDPDAALARAAEIDTVRRLVRGAGHGQTTRLSELSAHHPLLGLPTAFKDLVDVAGMPTTRGTAALPPQTPGRDDPLPRRLHFAGAVSVGKTQVPEFGLPCYSENSLARPSRNPLDPRRISGGSTGGGAAAVAAGMLPLAPGSDGGGSVRIPAAACGLVGLKPGRGRLPDDVVSDQVGDLVVSGPIAETAEDAALLFDVMAGHRFRAPERPGGRRARRRAAQVGPTLAEGPAMRIVREALDDGLEPLRVGVTTESPFSPELDVTLDEDAVRALEEAISRLEALGHQVQGSREGTSPDRIWPTGYHRHFQALWTSRLGQIGFTEDQLSLLAPLTRYFVELSSTRPQSETEQAQRTLQAFAEDAESCLDPWDVLVTPMLAFRPPEVGWFASLGPAEDYVQQCRFTPYSSVVNVMGLPAVNVPVLTGDDGLSWSVQIIGRHGAEERLLALAATLQRD
ncbi:amidase [Nesterenkonia sp. HG001]|uniref:amidase n=1 Tax=Nesterenkonia sp. HG001 TaxID=2983207 RepID=UPI002AC4020E|nr:amidase [Nesterenkonia sp. HG001]MDZ5078258.1 amidase [Nesterenkonia sp. HG001]